jgi:hypothetical protein
MHIDKDHPPSILLLDRSGEKVAGARADGSNSSLTHSSRSMSA